MFTLLTAVIRLFAGTGTMPENVWAINACSQGPQLEMAKNESACCQAIWVDDGLGPAEGKPYRSPAEW